MNKHLSRREFIAGALLAFIGLAAAARRFFVLLSPPSANPRFAAAAALDEGIAAHRSLTFVHIVPAFLFMGLVSNLWHHDESVTAVGPIQAPLVRLRIEEPHRETLDVLRGTL